MYRVEEEWSLISKNEINVDTFVKRDSAKITMNELAIMATLTHNVKRSVKREVMSHLLGMRGGIFYCNTLPLTTWQ